MKIYSRERKSSEGLQGKVYMNYFFLIENENLPSELPLGLKNVKEQGRKGTSESIDNN